MLQDTLKDKVSAMTNGRSAELLATLGLERRRSPVAIIGPLVVVLAAGAILGAAVALWMAPQSGHALRRRIKSKASDLVARIGKLPGEAASKILSVPSLIEDAIAA